MAKDPESLVRSLDGFTVTFPPEDVIPYWHMWKATLTGTTAGDITNLADLRVPTSQAFVLTNLEFRLFNATGLEIGALAPTGTAATAEAHYAGIIAFQVQVDGGSHVGQIGGNSAIAGEVAWSGFALMRTNLTRLFGWDAFNYACIIRPGGRLTTNVLQVAGISNPPTPSSAAGIVAGFFVAQSRLDEFMKASRRGG